jgi:hypothetical protein
VKGKKYSESSDFLVKFLFLGDNTIFISISSSIQYDSNY